MAPALLRQRPRARGVATQPMPVWMIGYSDPEEVAQLRVECTTTRGDLTLQLGEAGRSPDRTAYGEGNHPFTSRAPHAVGVDDLPQELRSSSSVGARVSGTSSGIDKVEGPVFSTTSSTRDAGVDRQPDACCGPARRSRRRRGSSHHAADLVEARGAFSQRRGAVVADARHHVDLLDEDLGAVVRHPVAGRVVDGVARCARACRAAGPSAARSRRCRRCSGCRSGRSGWRPSSRAGVPTRRTSKTLR